MEPNAIPRDMNTCAAALNQTWDKECLKRNPPQKLKKFWPILSSLLHTSIGSFKENNGISILPTLFACLTKIPANLYGLHSHLILTWENYSIPAVEEWLSAKAVGPTGLLWSFDFW